jgi:predicted TIM-barrel fold metal-dependent hydrolase
MFRGEDNGYIADVAAGRPDRLRAVCAVDPRISAAQDRLERWVVERGCRGLRLRPRVPEESAAFGSPDASPLWERARRLGVVVSVLADPAHLDATGALAARFPEVDIVIDHLAYPVVPGGRETAGFRRLLALARHPRVVIKLSGHHHFTDQPDPYPACWDLVHALYDRFGPERLIWGSDFPTSSGGRAMRGAWIWSAATSLSCANRTATGSRGVEPCDSIGIDQTDGPVHIRRRRARRR